MDIDITSYLLGKSQGGGGSTDVYRVSSVAEMNSLTPNENDICVVYGDTLNNITDIITKDSNLNIPQSVTLNIPDFDNSSYDYSWVFRSENSDDITINASYDSTTPTGMASISIYYYDEVNDEEYQYDWVYSSTDGIHFTFDEEATRYIMSDPTAEIVFNVTAMTTYTIESEEDYESYPFLASFIQVASEVYGTYIYQSSTWIELENVPDLQTKSITITSNGNTSVNADTGYNGLEQVNITTNVASLPDWSTIGYSSVPQTIIDSVAYSKTIKDNWNSSITNMKNKFLNDTKLVYMPLVDTSNVTNMQSCFYNCYALQYVPVLDTSNVTDASAMFEYCYPMHDIPQLDTSNVTNFNYTFAYCWTLENLPLLNTSKVTAMSNMFLQATKHLTDTSLNNILLMCINATSYQGNKTLAWLGIASSYVTTSKWQSLPAYQDFLDAGWTIGY